MKPRTHVGDICWQVRDEFPHDNDDAPQPPAEARYGADGRLHHGAAASRRPALHIGHTSWFAVASSRGRSAPKAKIMRLEIWRAGWRIAIYDEFGGQPH